MQTYVLFFSSDCIDTDNGYNCRCKPGFQDVSIDRQNSPGRSCRRSSQCLNSDCATEVVCKFWNLHTVRFRRNALRARRGRFANVLRASPTSQDNTEDLLAEFVDRLWTSVWAEAWMIAHQSEYLACIIANFVFSATCIDTAEGFTCRLVCCGLEFRFLNRI